MFKYLLTSLVVIYLALHSIQVNGQINTQQPTAIDNSVVKYPIVPAAKESSVFQLTVDGVSVFVEKYKDIHYTHFAFSGTVNLNIGIPQSIKQYSLSPKSYNLQCTIEKNRIYFSISRPSKLVIRINDYERLLIFADPVEDPFPPGCAAPVIDIMDFVVHNNGGTVLTKQIQKAISATPKNGVLYFPPGIFTTGTISLKSNMTLYLAGGALIQGSAMRDDYPVDQGWVESDYKFRREKWTHDGEKMTYSRLLLVDNAENITISGQGIIDGNGKIVRGDGKPANLIRIRNSKNIVLENLILRDSAAWSTHILHSENVIVRNVKIINDRSVKNTDGIDPDSSRHVVIENNFAYCGDDSVSIKSSNNSKLLRDVEDIVVRGNVFLTTKSALKIGTETRAKNIRNITFVDNDVIQCDRGMTIYCLDGAGISNIRFINNRFENNIENSGFGIIDFSIQRRRGKGLIDRLLAKSGIYDFLSSIFPSSIGHIRNVLIKNCRTQNSWPNPSTLKGYDDEHIISDVHFENFVIAGKVCRNFKEANINIEDHVQNITFSVTE